MKPADYCPVHGTNQSYCDHWCYNTRQEFLKAAADLEKYWRTVPLKGAVDEARRLIKAE